jgi:hypothetical protein
VEDCSVMLLGIYRRLDLALWLRAVPDVCKGLPTEVALEIERRSPVLLSRIESSCGDTARPRGSIIWEDLTHWAESNVFVRAKRERWLDAIRHFSSKSLLPMKAWSYWRTSTANGRRPGR